MDTFHPDHTSITDPSSLASTLSTAAGGNSRLPPHIMQSSDDEVLYHGRKVPRSTRLKQMRESQKLLRDKRKNRIKTLEDENQALKAELERVRELAALNCGLSDPLFRYDSFRFFPEKLQHKPLKYVAYDTSVHFHNKPFDKVSKLYLSEGKNITTFILEKTSRMIQEKDNLLLKRTVFRYIPTIGSALTFVENLETLLKTGTMPEHWYPGDNGLPDGVISLFGVVDYLLVYADVLRMSMEVFGAFVATFAFATHWGPAIFVFDLSTCVKAAINPMYDAAFLHNVLEKQVDAMMGGAVIENGPVEDTINILKDRNHFEP